MVRPCLAGLLAIDGARDASDHRALLRPTFGATDVAKLRTDDIDRFYRSLREGKSKSGQPLKPGTIRRIHVILRRAVAQGVK